MNDEIKDANLQLLVGLREHLDRAEQLRRLLDRLMSLAANRDQAKPKGDQLAREQTHA